MRLAGTVWRGLKGNVKAVRVYQRYGFQFDGAEKVSTYGTELQMIWGKGHR